jgi:hypothetical protein
MLFPVILETMAQYEIGNQGQGFRGFGRVTVDVCLRFPLRPSSLWHAIHFYQDHIDESPSVGGWCMVVMRENQLVLHLI